jgi:hypothetical protein
MRTAAMACDSRPVSMAGSSQTTGYTTGPSACILTADADHDE